MIGRSHVLLAAALLAAMQGGEAWARSVHRHYHHAPRVAPPRAVVPRVVAPRIVVVRYVQVIPRVAYVAPPLAYPTPAYYYTPATSYATPAGYAPPQTLYSPAPNTYYSEPAQSAAPSQAPAQAPVAGPYSEQAINYRHFCPDTRQYYPEVKECESGWLTVLPGKGRPPR